MSDAAPDSSLDAVMNEDGSLVVSPDQAARFHLKPGDHLRWVRLFWGEELWRALAWSVAACPVCLCRCVCKGLLPVTFLVV